MPLEPPAAAARPAGAREKYVKGPAGEVAVPGAAHDHPEAVGVRGEVVFDVRRVKAGDAEGESNFADRTGATKLASLGQAGRPVATKRPEC